MVRLNKIYTKTGDDGTTGLIGTARVSKASLRMEAIGAVDEANAMIGIARCHVKGVQDAMLVRIQQDLFDMGADLATAGVRKDALRIVPCQVTRLEKEIDAMNTKLLPLKSFVLPGGTDASATLHLARTIVRRAERVAVALSGQEKINPVLLHYLNRLSDHLFVLARVCNANGKKDVLWKPGVNR